jgi:DNA-directed RNA polymerase specialized sigma24 family protein
MDINEESFSKLLARLEPDLADSTARYKQLRLKMIKVFQWRRCEDAELLADETITRAVKYIIEGNEIRADDPYVFIRKIAKFVYNEHVRKEIKVKTLLADLIQMPVQPPIGSVDSEDCRTECLLNLSPDKLKLLQEYFLDVKSSKQLAEELDTTINGLRLKIHRIKKELESCFEECLKKLSGT